MWEGFGKVLSQFTVFRPSFFRPSLKKNSNKNRNKRFNRVHTENATGGTSGAILVEHNLQEF